MNSKERVATALSFQQPDRAPVFAAYTPEIDDQLRAIVGDQELDLGAAMGNDMVRTCIGLPVSYYMKPDPIYTCPWGITWHWVSYSTGRYTEVLENPLAGDESKLDSYQIPDPLADAQFDPLRDLLACYGDEKWIVGSSQCSIFEAAWALRGMSQFMMDMLDNRDYVHQLLDKVMQYPLQACKKFIEMGADMVWVGDDVAGQRRMLMSPQLWREYLKPRYAVMFEEFKRANPDIKICYHSDGNCEPILDEMVEIGLDVLNPVQPQATDPAHLKRRYGHKLALFGGLDVQDTLPFGSPDDVRNAVKELVAVCGRGGGYILAPSHVIQPDVPLDNILAFYDSALQQWGTD